MTNPAIVCGPKIKRRDWRKLPTSELTRAERNMRFVERYCRVPEADLVGQPIRLADFQEDFFYSVYDNPARTRKAILSMARKNAKTATIACIAIVHIAGPEARLNSRINSGARSRKQAAEVFNYAAKMIRLNPELSKVCRIVDSAKRIIGLAKNVEYEALSAEGKTAHGGSPVVAIMDEVGQIKGPNDEFWDAITTGQGAYDDALLIVISTQAPTDADLLSLQIDGAIASQDPQTVCHLYTASEDCDLQDEAAWRMANPALGLFKSFAEMQAQARSAQTNPQDEATFRVLGLNQRQSMHSPLVSKAIWTANGGEVLPFAGPVWAGLDLSQTTDLTCFVLVGKDVDGNWAVRPTFWMAGDLIDERSRKDREPYDVWSRQGLISAPSGKAIDYSWVAEQIAEQVAGLDMRGLAFDRYRMATLQEAMNLRGLSFGCELVPWGQGYASMSPAVDALEIELLNERVRHGDHPVLKMCARNAVVKRDEAGNRKLDKARSTGRIDGMVALAMAVGLAMTQEQVAQPQPGILII